MCGFAAVVGERNDAVVDAMVEAISSRGPDERAACSAGWFSLGCCRLAIFTLDAGRQPSTSPDGSVTVAFNGELYDFKRLARDMERATGARPRSEAELLVAGYQARGWQFVRELNGDFSVAIFDTSRRVCECWRDPSGVKPLYYAPLRSQRAMVVASEIRALLAHPDFIPEWDEVALAERFVLSFWARERTPFRTVRQVQPGHRLILGPHDPDRNRRIAVAEVNYAPAPDAEPAPAGRSEAVEACADVIARSVARRVTHTEVHPVAVALSGGVDSSILAALATRARASVVAVTVCGASDEPDAQYAAVVARRLGLAHHLHVVTTEGLLAGLPLLVLAQPASAVFLAWQLGWAIRRYEPRAKVLLCGEGADELFRGYRVHRNPTAFRVHARRRLAMLPERLVAASPLLRNVRKWDGADAGATSEEIVALFADHQLVNRHLLPFDHGMMTASVECRVPYLDAEVRAVAARLSPAACVSPSQGKLALRSVLARVFASDPQLARALLTRPPAAAPAATRAARSQLLALLAARLPGSPLAASRLGRLASTPTDLFWLGATDAIFMRHRGRIDGMLFSDLLEEAAMGPTADLA